MRIPNNTTGRMEETKTANHDMVIPPSSSMALRLSNEIE
jgi:hypothetical protein